MWCADCYTPHVSDRFPIAKPTDNSGFEWRSVKDKNKFKHAREGDHLLVSFECDLCIFRNLTGRNPLRSSPKDDLLMCCIRRMNLDAFWGRASQTVDGTKRAVKQMLGMWEMVGVEPSLPALGPFPVGDNFGYRVAIAMLLKSLEPGRHTKGNQQFETIRKMRAAFSNIYAASVEGAAALRSSGGDRAKLAMNQCQTNSLFFERFALGCNLRMGAIVKQDRAISLPVMHALMTMLEEEWKACETLRDRSLVASVGAYSIIAFTGSFRGNEVFLVDLHGLRTYLDTPQRVGEQDFVAIPLLGEFKGETGLQYHITPLAAKTKSGLPVKLWVERLVAVREEAGIRQGPAFCDSFGNIAQPRIYERAILERLAQIQLKMPSLIPGDVNVLEEYGISRSFRRGSTSEARARGVDDRDVDLANRWRNVENARGRKPRLAMRDHYSDIRILIPALIKYSAAL